MPESTRLVDLVQEGIDDFLDDREPDLAAIDSGLSPFIEYARDLLRGGKRFRALFCYWGWRATGAADGAGDLLTRGTSSARRRRNISRSKALRRLGGPAAQEAQRRRYRRHIAVDAVDHPAA